MSLHVETNSPELVTVHNLGESILPFFFFVGPAGFNLGWIGQLQRLLQGGDQH